MKPRVCDSILWKIKNKKMANITIDGQEYDLNDLSEKAKEQVGNLQFVQSEIKRLEAQLAVNKVAASVYSATLNSELKGV